MGKHLARQLDARRVARPARLSEQPHQRPLEAQRVGRHMGGGGQHLGQIQAAADAGVELRQRLGDAPAPAPRLAGQHALEGQRQQRQGQLDLGKGRFLAADDFQHRAGTARQ